MNIGRIIKLKKIDETLEITICDFDTEMEKVFQTTSLDVSFLIGNIVVFDYSKVIRKLFNESSKVEEDVFLLKPYIYRFSVIELISFHKKTRVYLKEEHLLKAIFFFAYTTNYGNIKGFLNSRYLSNYLKNWLKKEFLQTQLEISNISEEMRKNLLQQPRFYYIQKQSISKKLSLFLKNENGELWDIDDELWKEFLNHLSWMQIILNQTEKELRIDIKRRLMFDFPFQLEHIDYSYLKLNEIVLNQENDVLKRISSLSKRIEELYQLLVVMYVIFFQEKKDSIENDMIQSFQEKIKKWYEFDDDGISSYLRKKAR